MESLEKSWDELKPGPCQQKDFNDIAVSDVFGKIVLKASQVKASGRILEAIEEMISNPISRKVYVVDDDNRFLGTVTTGTILRLMGYRLGVRDDKALSLYRFLRDILKEDVKSIMVEGRTVTKDSKLTDVMKIMLQEHLNDVPVVDEDNRLIGELVSLELFLEGKRVFEEKD